ncbi:MAG: hypothetical protein ACHQF2_07190 [Flavobacteriales bacterium]
MKRILLSVVAVSMMISAIGQKADRTSAIMTFKDFGTALQEQKMDLAKKKILEAKGYIDKAYDGGFQKDHKTLYYRGLIYLGIIAANSPLPDAKANPCTAESKPIGLDEKTVTDYSTIGFTSLKEAMTTVSDKDDFTGTIKFAMMTQRINAINCGNENYNNKSYDKASDFYSTAIAVTEVTGQIDTMAYYNRGLCNERLGKNKEAAADFVVCANAAYGGADIYRLVFEAYSALNEIETGRKYLSEGRKKYPKDQGLVFSEVNYFLAQGNNIEAERAINEALALDPTNPTLYFALGNTYDNLANPRDKDGKELGKPKNFDELSLKAEYAYKQDIEIKSDYYDALYNIGVLKYNEGAEYMNRIKDIPDNTQYEAEKVKADEKFKMALPYLEKARTVNPKDRDNLRMLKNIYVRMGDAEKAAEIQKELEK